MTILKSSLLVLIIVLAISTYYINQLKLEVLSQKELMLYARVEALEYKKLAENEAQKAQRAAADAVMAESQALNALMEAKRQHEIAIKVLKNCNK